MAITWKTKTTVERETLYALMVMNTDSTISCEATLDDLRNAIASLTSDERRELLADVVVPGDAALTAERDAARARLATLLDAVEAAALAAREATS